MNTLNPQRLMTRRDAIKTGLNAGIGSIGALSLMTWLTGCTTPTASATGADAQATLGSGSTWASGGTAKMLATYPNPFTAGAAESPCILYPSATLGPCYAETLLRQDISEGYTGLPTRLSLRVVDATICEPMANATVDVWHTNVAGVYSALPTGSMCNPGSEDVSTKHFFRGVQTTDADGRVEINTVFPGWYSGRTIHIHFTVRVGNTAMVTSQLFFDDALTNEIMASHPDYNSRPARNTTNTNDGILPRSGQATYMLSTARMTDGVLQAYKTIAIRSA